MGVSVLARGLGAAVLISGLSVLGTLVAVGELQVQFRLRTVNGIMPSDAPRPVPPAAGSPPPAVAIARMVSDAPAATARIMPSDVPRPGPPAAGSPPPAAGNPLARCVPRKIIVAGAGMLAAVRAENAAWTRNDTYVEKLEDLVPFGVRVVLATEFEPAFPAHEEPTWRERARAIHAGAWQWGVHDGDHGKPTDGMARYKARFGTPEPSPGVAMFEDVLVNDVGDVKALAGPCACCLFFIKGCFSPVGKHALQQRDIVARWDSTPEHAEVISVACRHLAFYHIVMDSLTRVAMVESTLRKHPHIKVHNAWRGRQWGLRLPLQLDLNAMLMGIARERVVTGSVRAKRLIVPERAGCYRHSPLVIQRASAIMRGRVVGSARSAGPDACVVLVVDRSGAGKRNRVVQNSQDLLSTVRSAAAEAARACRVEVHSAALPLAEQLQRFASATLVVAPHGAALSQLLVCKRGTMVLELLNSSGWKVLCFADLALMLSMAYRGIFVPGAHHGGPMRLSPDVLRQIGTIALAWLQCRSEECRTNVAVQDLSQPLRRVQHKGVLRNAEVVKYVRTNETVVMAAAFKYKLPSFARFLVPLRRVYAGRIVLLTDSQTATLDIVRLCHEHGAELQSVASDRNVHVGRFALYAKVCNASYAWCFASDFRDVFFQANPFRVIPALQPQAELLLSEEYPGVRIGEERWNRGWVQSCFGHEGLKRIKTQQVICSGTIMGTPRGFAELRGKFQEPRFKRHQCRFVGSDQGILNYLFYTGELTSAVAQVWGTGIVNTVGLVPAKVKAHYIREGKLLVTNTDGTVSAVVHQYDRGLNASSEMITNSPPP